MALIVRSGGRSSSAEHIPGTGILAAFCRHGTFLRPGMFPSFPFPGSGLVCHPSVDGLRLVGAARRAAAPGPLSLPAKRAWPAPCLATLLTGRIRSNSDGTRFQGRESNLGKIHQGNNR